MSFEKIKEIKKLEVPITEIEVERIYYKCDNCKKLISGSSFPERWAKHTQSHQGWGNDSVDSIITRHSCSMNCLISNLKNSYEDINDYEEAKIDIEMNDKFLKEFLDYLEKGERRE